MLKDIVAVVQGGGKATEAVETALAFAMLHHAHIQINVVSDRVTLLAPFDPLARYYTDAEGEKQHLAQLEVVRAQASSMPADCDVRSLHEEPLLIPGRVDMRSRCADLVLVPAGPCWTDRRLRRRVIDAILGAAGAPTLLFPPGWRPERVRHAVLAWNGSAEAAQAARALITMVEPGATIDVVMVEPLHAIECHFANPGAEIVEHLSRHRFVAERHICPASGRPVAEVLESFATMRGAQLLAIGAYAHSRARQVIFGGTTRELIDFQRLPVLMTH
jgi:nucleotide-binding universal stress UspA family protein